MLVLGRKLRETIVIGEQVRVTVTRIGQSGVRLAIEAPREIPVRRAELVAAAADGGGQPVAEDGRSDR